MWLFLICKMTCLLNVSAFAVLLLTLYSTMQLLLLGFLLLIHLKKFLSVIFNSTCHRFPLCPFASLINFLHFLDLHVYSVHINFFLLVLYI